MNNKNYTSKWNAALGAWVACSEITRRAGKAVSAVLFIAASGGVYAAGICPGNFAGTAGSVVYMPGDNPAASAACDVVPANASPTNLNLAGNYLLTRSRLNSNGITAVNVGAVNILSNVANTNDFGGIGNQFTVAPMTINVESFTANITRGLVTSMGSHSGVDINIVGDTNLTINSSYPSSNLSGGAETYGAVVGSSVISGEGNTAYNGRYTTATLSNLMLNQTTTGGTLVAILNSGLRAIQGAGNGNGTSGKIVVTGMLDMTLTGRRIEGIYVSGAASNPANNGGAEAISQVVMNNSKFTMNSQGANNSSSAIKIGKTRAVGTGKGLVVSNGFMQIDASLAIGDAIKLAVSGSELQANGPGSSADILANRSALTVGTVDWASSTAATGIKAAMGKAKVRTVSASAPLLLVDGGQTNVELLFDNGSDLAAATNGYLIDMVNANNRGAASTATATFDHGTTVAGLTNKLAAATLNVAVNNTSTWNLLEKSNGDKTSTYTTFAMTAGSTLNAFKAGAAAFVMNGPVTSDASTTNLVDGAPDDVLTVQPSYAGSNGAALAVDTCLAGSGAASDKLAVNGSTSGTTVLKVSPFADAACSGADTSTTGDGNGILVVQVSGSSNGVFTLPNGPILQGSFVYDLVKVGNDWYLQSKAAPGGQITVSKTVNIPAGSPAYSGSISFDLACTNPVATYSGTVSVSNNTGVAAPVAVPFGSNCTISETLPTVPSGYRWDTPVYTQPPGPMPAGGSQTATIVNTLLKADNGTGGEENVKRVPANNPWALGLLSLAILAPWGARRYREKRNAQR